MPRTHDDIIDVHKLGSARNSRLVGIFKIRDRGREKGKKVYIDIEPRVLPNFFSLVGFPTCNTAQALAKYDKECSGLYDTRRGAMVPAESRNTSAVADEVQYIVCDGSIMYSSSGHTGYRGYFYRYEKCLLYSIPEMST